MIVSKQGYQILVRDSNHTRFPVLITSFQTNISLVNNKSSRHTTWAKQLWTAIIRQEIKKDFSLILFVTDHVSIFELELLSIIFKCWTIYQSAVPWIFKFVILLSYIYIYIYNKRCTIEKSEGRGPVRSALAVRHDDDDDDDDTRISK